MIRKTMLIVGLGVFTAMFAVAGSTQAGTCQPVAAKGYGKDAAMATARASKARAKGSPQRRQAYEHLNLLQAEPAWLRV